MRMSPEESKSSEKSDLIIRRESGLTLLPNSVSSALAEIISRSLVHIQSNKALSGMVYEDGERHSLVQTPISQSLATLHRIGEHELYGPDYSLVCAWARELQLTPEETMRRLLKRSRDKEWCWDTRIEEGRFKNLCVVASGKSEKETLSVSSIPSIKGLVVEKLYLSLKDQFKVLDLSMFPKLKALDCSHNKLTELDLSQVPNLKELWCSYNQLIELNLFHVPNLTLLWCGDNQLSFLDLSHVPNLTLLQCCVNQLTVLDLSHVTKLEELMCTFNHLTALDLSCVPDLTELWCDNNQLSELNLSHVPNLRLLQCIGNKLTELDIRTLRKLMDLGYVSLSFDRDEVRLTQRSDQYF